METEQWRMNFIINNKFDDDWWISLILYEKWVFMNDELSYMYFLLWNFLHMILDQGSFLKNKLWLKKIGILLPKNFRISWICSKKIKIFLEICNLVAKICHNKKQFLWPMFSISANYQDSSKHVPIYSQRQFCKPRGFKEATLNHACTLYNI